jgi:hypothetical protein
MKPWFFKTNFYITLVILTAIAVLANACNSSGNEPPVISSLKANNTNVYPLGKSEIQCVAWDPEGDQMSFKWSCTDGTFTGSGPIVTWKAPNSYGNYHIMVIAEDQSGNSTEAALTIGVVVNQDRPKLPCCQ